MPNYDPWFNGNNPTPHSAPYNNMAKPPQYGYQNQPPNMNYQNQPQNMNYGGNGYHQNIAI